MSRERGMRDHLISDLVHAYAQLDQPARTLLRQLWISNQTMKKYPGPIGIATIEIHALNIFSFAEVGTKAFIIPVYFGGNDSEITDVMRANYRIRRAGSHIAIRDIHSVTISF